MSGFDTWGSAAGGVADNYGIPRPIFYGLIQQESSWNPNAAATGSSAYGFTQLLKGTAADLGVNRYDPMQNLNGGASYLSSLYNKFGNWNTALAAYHDGAGAVGQHGGFAYASSVMSKAKGYLDKGGSLLDKASGLFSNPAVDAGLNALIPGAGSALGGISGIFGGGGDSCGMNPFCYLRQWIADSGFFQRLALAVFAFIMLFAAFYLLKSKAE